MSDRPIIFSAPMVRAIIDGRKTQTRRFPSIRGHRSISEFGRSTTDGYDWTFRDAHKRWHDLGKDGVECSIHFGGTIEPQSHHALTRGRARRRRNQSGTRRRFAT